MIILGKAVMKHLSLLLVLLAITTRCLAGEPNVPADSCKVPLLAGVMHFNDDDVRFHTTDGINVFVDPTLGPDDKLVARTGYTKADLILITHRHGDHFQPGLLKKYVKANPKVVIAGPADVVAASKSKSIEVSPVEPDKDYTMAGVSFHTMPAYFADGDSHQKDKKWVGYILKIDGKSYYVTGDTGPFAEMTQQKVDVVFPLLAGCGGNMPDAVKMSQMSGATVVVPVHHSNQQETINKFIAQIPKGSQAVYYMDGELLTEPRTPPAPAPETEKK
jgi:L-ascorbate metabolism protein UlaG (beta-lactamase superfamily)